LHDGTRGLTRKKGVALLHCLLLRLICP
jgi:hypothetical protein